jgi:hypothetical protein
MSSRLLNNDAGRGFVVREPPGVTLDRPLRLKEVIVVRISRIVVLTALALALALAGTLGACGATQGTSPGPVETTPAAQSTESTNTAATDVDALAAADIQKMSDYTAQLETWFRDFTTDFQDELDEALQFKDPTAPTESELLRARQDTDLMRQSVAKLTEMSAPAKVAHAHTQLCSAMRAQLASLERYVNAVDWGSARDIELAVRDAQQSAQLFAQAVTGLQPYVDLSSVTQN